MWNGVKIKEGRRIFCDALFDILMLLADWEITSRSKLREVILYCTKKNVKMYKLNIYYIIC